MKSFVLEKVFLFFSENCFVKNIALKNAFNFFLKIIYEKFHSREDFLFFSENHFVKM